MNNSDQQWKVSQIAPELAENEIHVWQASLSVDGAVLHMLQKTLTEEEVTQAKQFYFEKDQQHFTIARGVLRTLLAQYVHTDPSLLRFDYNAYGKPSLGHPFNESRLHFNVSHSHEIALYAFTYARQIGVDVEYMRSDIEYDQLAKYSFSAHEQAVLYTLPKALKQQAFFNCWTRKEAYIKAKGKGLSIPLDLFDVSLEPGEPARLLASRETDQETICWSLQELLPSFGYAGALAVEGCSCPMSYWRWE